MLTFQEFQQKYKSLIEQYNISEVYNHSTLGESMKYSLQATGKRLRPLLILAVLSDFDREITEDTIKVAVALEWIHTYSLIHDDLPAMDNDDLRRGKPTNHKVYGEATAILAGDSLLTDAFLLISQTQLEAEMKVQLIEKMAIAAGSQGMIEGQMRDLQGEGKQLTLNEIEQIHKLKTGALLEFAVWAGSLLAKLDEHDQHYLLQYAKHLGLAFQIRDDILDVISTTNELGKQVGRDEELAKSTYPSLLGVVDSIQLLQAEIKKAITALDQCSKETSLLKDLILQLEVQA